MSNGDVSWNSNHVVCWFVRRQNQGEGWMGVVTPDVHLKSFSNVFRRLKPNKDIEEFYLDCHWRIQACARDARPVGVQSKFFHFHAVFGKKIQNNRSRLAHPFWELAPPPRKILDPPLIVIYLCLHDNQLLTAIGSYVVKLPKDRGFVTTELTWIIGTFSGSDVRACPIGYPNMAIM